MYQMSCSPQIKSVPADTDTNTDIVTFGSTLQALLISKLGSIQYTLCVASASVLFQT